MNLQRWFAANIIEYFIKHPKGTIFISDADKKTWLAHTDNIIVVSPSAYTVDFKSRGGGIWEAALKYDHPVLLERRLRLK